MKTITLSRPITYGQQQLTELTLRAPAAGDLRGVQLRQLHDMDAAILFVLIPRLSTTALTAAHLHELAAPDVIQLMEALSDFFAT